MKKAKIVAVMPGHLLKHVVISDLNRLEWSSRSSPLWVVEKETHEWLMGPVR